MPTVVDALFEDLRPVLLKVREGAGVIVGLDRDVLYADMLLMILVGYDGRHVELNAVQVELASCLPQAQRQAVWLRTASTNRAAR
jgi:hypothetical protein